jgi:hypothetical protein
MGTGLTDREQALLAALSAFLIAVGAINPTNLPHYLQILIALAGVLGFFVKEFLGSAVGPAVTTTTKETQTIVTPTPLPQQPPPVLNVVLPSPMDYQAFQALKFTATDKPLNTIVATSINPATNVLWYARADDTGHIVLTTH